MTSTREPCVKCVKGGGIVTCGGCQQRLCMHHFTEHRQELTNQMENINQDYDLFQHDLNEEHSKHPFILRINQWEEQIIEKIHSTAEEARKNIQQCLDLNKIQLKTSMDQITKELKECYTAGGYTEIDVNKYIQELKQLRQKLEKPPNFDIVDNDHIQPTIHIIKRQECQTMINTPTQPLKKSIGIPVKIDDKDRWIQHGITVAGGFGQGSRFNQLYGPHGLYVDHEKTLYIADSDNHRILGWKHDETDAYCMAGGYGRGNQINRLDNPLDIVVDQERNSLIICDRNNRRVMRCSSRNRADEQIIISNINCQGMAMDNEGFIYISDSAKHEVRRHKIGENNGTIVAGGNGRGDRLNQLNSPANIFVDQDKAVYVSDANNYRIVKWLKDSKEGILVAGGNGKGNKLTQLANPRGLTVDALGNIYVVDGWNHRVMRWCIGSKEGCIIVGGNGQGEQSCQLNYPEGLALDLDGNIYVADCLNNRIQRFNIQKNKH